RIGDVLRAPVAPDPEAAGDVLREAAEHVAHALAKRLQRGPAIADLRGVPAHELVDAVIDGAEEPAPAVLRGVEARRVGALHLIRARADDAPESAAKRACRRGRVLGAPGAPGPCGTLRRGRESPRAPRGWPRRPRHRGATSWAHAWPRPGGRRALVSSPGRRS